MPQTNMIAIDRSRATSAGANRTFKRIFRFPSLSIQLRLPLAFVGLAFLAIVAVMAASAYFTLQAERDTAEKAFHMSVSTRAEQLESWLHTTKSTLAAEAAGQQAIDALTNLSAGFEEFGANATRVLQRAYIDENPNPVGMRHKLDSISGDELYHAQHAKYHKSFRAIMEQHGLYDVFLINTRGNVVYTVFKEVDFAANLVSGPLSTSGLGKVFAKALVAKPGETFLSEFEPYGPSAGKYALFLATPVVNDFGTTIGVMAIQVPEDNVGKITSQGTVMGHTTDIYAVTTGGISMSPSRGANTFDVGTKVQLLPHVSDGLEGKSTIAHDVILQSGKVGSVHTYIIDKYGPRWVLVAERDNEDILSDFDDLFFIQVSIGAAAMIVVAGIGLAIARTFSRPIAGINSSIRDVAAGKLDIAVGYTNRADEIGTIARSLDDMRHALAAARAAEREREVHQQEQAKVVSNLTTALQDLANGDLTKSLLEPFAESYEGLRGNFNDAVQKMRDSLLQIATASERIRFQSAEITKSSDDLAHRTEVQAATLEQTAAAMDEMTSSVKSAAAGVREVDTIVIAARQDANECSSVVHQAVMAMSEIEKSSAQITQIIGVIDDIAFQTNLLALNAGVEAARAGESGRGFAVVASEVGALAQRASTAAKEISQLISTSTQHVGSGVERVKEAGLALQKITQRVSDISALTTNIATGAQEQSIGLNEINLGVIQLDQSTQQNAAMAEEANAASQQMASGAEELAQLVARFKLDAGSGTEVGPFSGKPNAPLIGNMLVAGSNVPAISASQFNAIGSQNGSPNDSGLAKSHLAVVANARGIWQDF